MVETVGHGADLVGEGKQQETGEGSTYSPREEDRTRKNDDGSRGGDSRARRLQARAAGRGEARRRDEERESGESGFVVLRQSCKSVGSS